MMKLSAPVLALAMLAGCASLGVSADSDDVPAARLAEVDAVPEIRDEAIAQRFAIGKVAGESCRRSYWGAAPSWEETVRRTKFEALKAGANAIAHLECSAPQGRSYTKLCFDSIRCTADAIRLDK